MLLFQVVIHDEKYVITIKLKQNARAKLPFSTFNIKFIDNKSCSKRLHFSAEFLNENSVCSFHKILLKFIIMIFKSDCVYIDSVIFQKVITELYCCRFTVAHGLRSFRLGRKNFLH